MSVSVRKDIIGAVFRSPHAAIKLPKRGFVVAGFLLYALALPLLALIVSTGVYPLASLLIHCFLFGTMSLVYGYSSTKNSQYVHGTLAVTHRGLEIDGTLVAAKDDLEQGIVMPTDQGTLVRFKRKATLSPPIFVKVKNEHEGIELLSALGFDAAHTAAEMRLATGLAAMPVWKQMSMILPPIFFGSIGAMLTALALHRTAGPYIFAILATMLVWVFGIAFAPTKVRVGTDGVVSSWLGREQFHSFADIERAERYEEYIGTKLQHGVRLILKAAEAVRLPTGQTDIGRSNASALLERIEEARAARRQGHVATTSDLLVRGTRSVAEWIAILRKVGSGTHDFRTNAVPLDTLLDVVENPAAPPSQRAGAAVAAANDPSARERIRIAAEATASPKLRVALDRIADEKTPEADLATALEELSAS